MPQEHVARTTLDTCSELYICDTLQEGDCRVLGLPATYKHDLQRQLWTGSTHRHQILSGRQEFGGFNG